MMIESNSRRGFHLVLELLQDSYRALTQLQITVEESHMVADLTMIVLGDALFQGIMQPQAVQGLCLLMVEGAILMMMTVGRLQEVLQ